MRNLEINLRIDEGKPTILLSDHTGSCCRSSSNASVSCDATGVVDEWVESTQCSCGL